MRVNWAERIDLDHGAPGRDRGGEAPARGREGGGQAALDGRQELDAHGVQPRTPGVSTSRCSTKPRSTSSTRTLPVYKPGERYMGVENTTAPRKPGEPWGYFGALDPLTAKPKWKMPLVDLPSWSGMLATAGGLVFSGKADRRIRGDRRGHRQDRCGSSRPAPGSTPSRSPTRTRGGSTSPSLSGLGGGLRRNAETEGKSASRRIGVDLRPDAGLANRLRTIAIVAMLALARHRVGAGQRSTRRGSRPAPRLTRGTARPATARAWRIRRAPPTCASSRATSTSASSTR